MFTQKDLTKEYLDIQNLVNSGEVVEIILVNDLHYGDKKRSRIVSSESACYANYNSDVIEDTSILNKERYNQSCFDRERNGYDDLIVRMFAFDTITSKYIINYRVLNKTDKRL